MQGTYTRCKAFRTSTGLLVRFSASEAFIYSYVNQKLAGFNSVNIAIIKGINRLFKNDFNRTDVSIR